MEEGSNLIQQLERKDLSHLNKIMNEAQMWVSQSREQARDVLLDEPLLRFALYHIPKILERRYREMDEGIRDATGNLRQAHPGSNAPQGYRNASMQGQFYDFQSGSGESGQGDREKPSRGERSEKRERGERHRDRVERYSAPYPPGPYPVPSDYPVYTDPLYGPDGYSSYAAGPPPMYPPYGQPPAFYGAPPGHGAPPIDDRDRSFWETRNRILNMTEEEVAALHPDDRRIVEEIRNGDLDRRGRR
jgi:hypothetical protein